MVIIARAQNSGILVAREGAKSGREQIKDAEMLKFGLYPKGKELLLSGGKQGICLHIEICFCLHQKRRKPLSDVSLVNNVKKNFRRKCWTLVKVF